MGYTLNTIKIRFENLTRILNFPHLKKIAFPSSKFFKKAGGFDLFKYTS
jgi:hypothetical protein